jgi:hypothetical protein
MQKPEAVLYPIPGHTAFSILGNRYFQADWIPVLIGGILPDLIDKPLNDVFLWTPYGRYAMHSLAGCAAVTLLVYFFTNWKTASSYTIGHFSHLIADMDFNPWFWPFVEYRYPQGSNFLDIFRNPSMILFPYWIALEFIILGLAILLYTRFAKKKPVQAAILIAIAALSIYRITRQRAIPYIAG